MISGILILALSSEFGNIARYYPKAAAEDEVGGQATIECVVQPDGSLKACKILSETPQNYGFGKATVRMFEREFNVNEHPERPEKNVAGDNVKFTFKWRLG